MERHLRRLGALVILAWLMAAPMARAQGFRSRVSFQDFDYLAYTSTAIVEGTIVGAGEVGKGKAPGLNVEVTKVYRGEVKVGDVLPVAYLDAYRKQSGEPLDFGEHFILFLTWGAIPPVSDSAIVMQMLRRSTAKPKPEEEDSNDCYSALSGGVRLVQGDKVIDFESRGDELKAYLGQKTMILNSGERTLEEFRAKLAKSLKLLEEIAPHLSAKDTAAEVPWMIQFLVKRSKERRFLGVDPAAAAVVERLAATVHDPAGMDGIVEIDYMTWAQPLYAVFVSPQGRDYLFGKLTDSGVPPERKVLYAKCLARAIGPAAPRAAATTSGSGSGTTSTTADIVSVPQHFALLERLVRLAVENQKNESFCVELMRCAVAGAVRYPVKPGVLPQETRALLAPLHKIYEATSSENMKYEMEVMLAWNSRADYEQFGSKGGPIISRARLLPPSTGAPAVKDGKFHFYCDWTTVDHDRVDECRMILENVQTQRSHTILIKGHEKDLKGNRGMTFDHTVDLPKDFQNGKHRIHFEFVKDGKIISVGHVLETEL